MTLQAEEDDFALLVLLKFLISVREAQGLSREAIAAVIGVDTQWVTELETDLQSIRASTLQRYVRALGGRVTFSLETQSDNSEIRTFDGVKETSTL